MNTMHTKRARGIVSATISSGGSLSSAINLDGQDIWGILWPAEWTSAAVTFQVSQDGVTYVNLYDEGASEVIIPAADLPTAEARAIQAWEGGALACASGWPYMKIRSGTAASAVNQAADRIITILTRG